MTRQAITLPAPLAYISSVTAIWTSFGGRRIDAALVAGDAEAYVVYVSLNVNGTVQLALDRSAAGTGSSAGPDFSAAFERGGSVTLAYGGRSMSLAAAEIGGDSAEPYTWQGSASSAALLIAALSTSATGAVLTLDDGVQLVAAAPALPVLPDLAATVGVDVNRQLPAATAGHPAPAYSATGLPDGLQFDPSSRRITGRPTAAGTATVTYRAANSEGSASRTFEISVSLPPVAPTLGGTYNDRSVTVGTPITSFTLPAATAGRPEPTYALSGLPAGLDFDRSSRRITGTPAAAIVGTYTLRLTATNGAGSDSVTFTLRVRARPTRPDLPAVPDRSVTVDAAVDITLPAATAGHPAPAYSTTGLPAGLDFDPSSRRITGRANAVGISTVTYRAANSEGSASRTFELSVQPITRSPAERFARARRELSPADVALTALEISHPALQDPVRVVNDVEDREIDGERYVALRFDARLATDADGQVPRAEIALDNVGRPLTQWIEAAGGGAGASVRVIQVIAGESDVLWEATMRAGDIHVGQTQVRIPLTHEHLLGRRAVRVRHDPETTPGLF